MRSGQSMVSTAICCCGLSFDMPRVYRKSEKNREKIKKDYVTTFTKIFFYRSSYLLSCFYVPPMV